MKLPRKPYPSQDQGVISGFATCRGSVTLSLTHRTTCGGDKQYSNFHNSLFSFLQLKIIAHSINIELVGVKCVVYNENFFDKYIRKDYMSSGAPSGWSRRYSKSRDRIRPENTAEKGNR
jgi:hypothetical protein